jgi:hypothetical protein
MGVEVMIPYESYLAEALQLFQVRVHIVGIAYGFKFNLP